MYLIPDAKARRK